jgi:hypothetical protein
MDLEFLVMAMVASIPPPLLYLPMKERQSGERKSNNNLIQI